MNIAKIQVRVTELKGQKIQLENQIQQGAERLKQKQEMFEKLDQAREIIRQVGLRTQQQLQFHISDITSLALDAVFDDPYQLKVEFVERRNKTECDLFFVRNGQEIDPLEASGYGAVDVAAMALRIASWSMKNPKSDNVIVLDEPFRFLSQDRQELASKMLKELSSRLGIQFIIVTHEDILAQYADRVFLVQKRKDRPSRVSANDN